MTGLVIGAKGRTEIEEQEDQEEGPEREDEKSPRRAIPHQVGHTRDQERGRGKEHSLPARITIDFLHLFPSRCRGNAVLQNENVHALRAKIVGSPARLAFVAECLAALSAAPRISDFPPPKGIERKGQDNK